jgi:4-hydroxy-tetrahydrodipicolinate synthase
MSSSTSAKEWARENLKGLWTSPMIPFTADGSVDEAGIRHNVDHLIATGVDGLGFGFSEPWYMTLQERMDAFRVFIDAIAGRVPAYCHALDYSVPETINLVNYCQGIGADAVMLWTPMEFAKSQGMVCDWFEYVASQVTMPIFAYNTYHSHINFSLETIMRLAELENVCALKDAVNDFGHTVEAMNAVGDQIVVSNPLEKHFAAMRTYMNQQVLLGATSVFLMQSPSWQPIRDYVRLIDEGKTSQAWEAFFALDSLRDVWNSIYANLWDQGAALHPIAIIKYWMDLVGMTGGMVRPPLPQITEKEKDAFRARLEATGALERLQQPA